VHGEEGLELRRGPVWVSSSSGVRTGAGWGRRSMLLSPA
jgi:hypothetical protein